MPTRRFYRSENGESFFWYLNAHGKNQTVWEGSLGTTGKKQTKTFETAKRAKAASAALVDQRLKAGYVEYPPRELSAKQLSARRGSWSTWADPTTWSVCMLRLEAGDLLAELQKCSCVDSVTDVTSDVLASRFIPPKRDWSLLVETNYQPWAMFVDRGGYNQSLDDLPRQFSGECLRTGGVKGNGICYVWYWMNGQSVLDFRTDGMGWPSLPEDHAELDEDEEDEDWGAVYVFETKLYPNEWPYSFARAEMAHQRLIVDRDAYVPLLTYHEKLEAEYGHHIAAAPQNIVRVSHVDFAESD